MLKLLVPGLTVFFFQFKSLTNGSSLCSFFWYSVLENLMPIRYFFHWSGEMGRVVLLKSVQQTKHLAQSASSIQLTYALYSPWRPHTFIKWTMVERTELAADQSVGQTLSEWSHAQLRPSMRSSSPQWINFFAKGGLASLGAKLTQGCTSKVCWIYHSPVLQRSIHLPK